MIAWLRNHAPYEGWLTFLLGALGWLLLTLSVVPLMALLLPIVRALP